MSAYIVRRLLYAVPILLGVSMLVFALIHLAPGDVLDLLVPPEVPMEIADSLRARFALDQPVYTHADEPSSVDVRETRCAGRGRRLYGRRPQSAGQSLDHARRGG